MATSTTRDLERLCEELKIPREQHYWLVRRAAGMRDGDAWLREMAARYRRDK